MESLHLSFSRAVDAGIFQGINVREDLKISHLFYADDASHLLGVGVPFEDVNSAAMKLRCSTMRTPFKYLGVMVGGNTSTVHAWDDIITKVKVRLSNWKLKTLSVGGRLTLLKSVLGFSIWNRILKEVSLLKDRRVDLLSYCHIRVGNGLRTQFWNEVWIAGVPLCVLFPRIYALESVKDCSVASKIHSSVTHSFRRDVRGGVESSQLALLEETIGSMILSNLEDRWVWDMDGEGVFRVKDVRNLLDDCYLPKADTATRWVRYVPIKLNVFAWKLLLDRLPTRSNLLLRGVFVPDLSCSICSTGQETSSHLFFSYCLISDVIRLVC
nr:RNA-directed DNA polymerase, eukaryota [Tanacetum cinerariifolium]